jgi:hypothetical protein
MISRKIFILLSTVASLGLSLGVLYAAHSGVLASLMRVSDFYIWAGMLLVSLGALFVVYAVVGTRGLAKGRWLLAFVGISGLLTGSASILDSLRHRVSLEGFRWAVLLLVCTGCLAFQLAVISSLIYFVSRKRSS